MIKPLVILLLLSSMWASTHEFTCDVSISRPLMYTYVPQGSTVHINCTGDSSQSPAWSVRLTETASNLLHFGKSTALLNRRGFYEINLPSDGSEQNVVQLLVNSTRLSDENNRTLVRCADVASDDSPTLFETTLVIYEPSRTIVTSDDVSLRSINISWSPLSSLELNHSQAHYFLRVEGHNTFNESFQLSQPYYYFTAPEDAPPCEVYNFSVSATYVGATYTGAGCSVPSPVLSTMLPSLPDIERLESSLEFGLMMSSSRTTLTVSFEGAKCCEQCPMVNYVLEVNHSSSDVWNHSRSVSPGEENVIHNLTENTNYSFRVLVSNGVGVVSTNEHQIFTTDVQNVTATPVETMNAFVVQCVFITGSNAQGCMVVLVGEFDNITANLSNLEEKSSKVLNVSHPLSCYREIFAFDIESDGSVGTLAVPGVINVSHASDTTSCISTTVTFIDTSEKSGSINIRDTLIIIIAIGCSVPTGTLTITVIVVYIYRRNKRSKKFPLIDQPLNVSSNKQDKSCSEPAGHCTNEDLVPQAAESLYDQPIKAQERCSEHTTAVEREMNTYAEIVEENHHYHTLEPQRAPLDIKVDDIDPDPDAPALPPPYRPPSPSLEQPPLYQEIGSVLQVAKPNQGRESTNGEIVNDQYQSSQNQPPPGEAQVSSETLL